MGTPQQVPQVPLAPTHPVIPSTNNKAGLRLRRRQTGLWATAQAEAGPWSPQLAKQQLGHATWLAGCPFTLTLSFAPTRRRPSLHLASPSSPSFDAAARLSNPAPWCDSSCTPRLRVGTGLGRPLFSFFALFLFYFALIVLHSICPFAFSSRSVASPSPFLARGPALSRRGCSPRPRHDSSLAPLVKTIDAQVAASPDADRFQIHFLMKQTYTCLTISVPPSRPNPTQQSDCNPDTYTSPVPMNA